MENNENLVTEVTENAEVAAEQTPKTYTDDEVNAIVGKRLARQEQKIRREYDRKYGRLEDVLKAGTGKTDVAEISDAFEQFYESKGVQIAKKPEYTAKDLETLAHADAAEFINGGIDDVVEEVERLAEIGAENMTAREKAMYKVLADHRQKAERSTELAKLGVTEDVINSPEFKELQGMFKADTPISKVYELYQKTQPKKDIKPMGSMKNTPADNGVKDYYSYEEASKFTRKDYDANPELFKAVERSMRKWTKK